MRKKSNGYTGTVAVPNDDPLKLRTFKLSERTYRAMEAIAEQMSLEKGVNVSRADVLRILVDEEAKRRQINQVKKTKGK